MTDGRWPISHPEIQDTFQELKFFNITINLPKQSRLTIYSKAAEVRTAIRHRAELGVFVIQIFGGGETSSP